MLTVLDARPALIVVDLQPLTLGNARVHTAQEVIERTAAVVEAFREQELPIAFVTSTGLPSGRTVHGAGGRRWPERMTPVATGVNPQPPDLVVTREGMSAFASEDLDDWLRARGVTQVVLAGLVTSFGVESTARAAYDLDYNVVVIADAVSDMTLDAHHRSITQVMPMLAEITDTTDLIERLRDQATGRQLPGPA